ncbi:MAG: hypothetical protein AAF468_14005 [Pseudomonadota bacterium]
MSTSQPNAISEGVATAAPFRMVGAMLAFAAAGLVSLSASAQQQADKQAFLNQLVGSWSVASYNFNSSATKEQIAVALARCGQTRTIDAVTVQQEAERFVPDQGKVRGSLLYYQTQKGLQRLDVNRKEVTLINSIEPVKLRVGGTGWKLTAKAGTLTIAIGRFGNRTGSRPMLIENKALLVKCRPTATSQ